MPLLIHAAGWWLLGLFAGALLGEPATRPAWIARVVSPPALAGITIPKAYRTGSSTLACDVPRSGTVFDIDITTK